MPLQKHIIPIPIGPAGINTRQDNKSLAPPELEVAENVKFTVPGRLEKREGLSNGACAADAVASAGDALFALRRDATKVYDSAAASFVSIPPLTSLIVDRLMGSGSGALHGDPDVARAGGRDYMVSEASVAGGAIRIHCYSRTTTDGYVLTSQSVSSGVSRPRIVAIGSSVYVFYVSGANLLFTSSSNGALGSEVTVVSNLNASPRYDVAVSGSQILLAYRNTAGDIISGYVNTSGVLGGTNTDTPAAAINCLGVAVAGNLNYGIMWGMNSTTTVTARLYNSSKVALTAATTVDNTASTAIRHVVGCFDTAGTTLAIFYECTDPLDLPQLYRVKRGTINTSAAVTAATFYRHSTLLSKPWLIANNGSDQMYICLGYYGALQASVMIARYNASSAAGQIVGRAMPDEVNSLSRQPGFVSQAQLVGSMALVGFPGGSAIGGGNIPVTLMALSIGHVDQFTAAAQAGQLYVVGSMLEIASPISAGAATGTSFGNCESAPLLFPEYFTFTPANNGAGNLTSNTIYSYRLYWEMFDGNGAVVRSSYAGSQLVTMGGTDNQVTIVVNTLAHTNTSGNSKPMWLGVYRSTAGPGSIHYRVSQYPSFITSGANFYLVNDPTVDTITFVDRRSDVNLVTNEIDYQSGSPVELDNIPPPPHRVIAVGNNRVFISGLDSDPNIIWISKLRESALEPVVFNDALTISVDAGDGPITGLTCVRDSLIVFREHQIYVVGGDGPDNTGFGGAFSPAQIVSEDVGCIEQRSIVRIPPGVIFKSKKGMYLLGNDLSLTYIGARVEDFNSEVITSAVALTANHEVRFTTSARTMIYDYLANAWATWTVPATHACLWNDQWVPLDGTTVMFPTPGTYLDRTGAGYTMAIETGWLHFGSLQMWQRLYEILFLGSYGAANHVPRVRIAYDYNPTWVDDVDWTAVTSAPPYQFRVRPSRQRFQAIKIRIEDVASGGTLTNGFTLSEMALVVGIEQIAPPLGTGNHAV